MYDMITDHLHNVQDIGQQYIFETPIYLESLLPPNKDLFYRYFGSYTTPKCNEAVTWIVYPELVFIGRNQIKKFRTLFTTTFDIRTGHLKRMIGNIRHLQDIAGRKIYTSGKLPINSDNVVLTIPFMISK
ncbi:carbonic anhydrase 12-like [Oppia nitens]|uniref:carbonic anhydrase 12-like n=1 Tax=Oppia nitens TaxID=1686743 RepID=UPI0023DC642E|nr:carbonic anhydrase 12-like [Oppia nitens]